ncbi:hypothetical protein CBF34_05495 [Vagococcus penaei]|uniref:Uncharacterized protein n=1 Tax=Vagococcus penaei TaxID=633807 RepID=A0A1Q2D3Q3_9ENTE|nr:GNAT family N-acetyltransferase [Vagococcus penaei]AQP53010.1 hypothetical protein BW732_01395 [Vagococcus penaei]RSU02530.1 hypothetical protein CBF34_05495 [Vagococcus penaei]
MIMIKETKLANDAIHQDALTIRLAVFVAEQQVPIELEVEDEERCVHIVLYEDNVPMGTARMYEKAPGVYKVQRVAVLPAGRGKKFGEALMTYLADYVKNANGQELVLDAQLQALGFYEKLGYRAFGEVFDDAGIDHRHMSYLLD